MKRPFLVATLGLTLLASDLFDAAAATDQTIPRHKYLLQAVFTPDGIKNLQKQSASAFKAGVAKFVESTGGNLESWYFDYADSTAYGFVDYPSEIAAATAQASVNSAGLARVTYRPVLSADDADKALGGSSTTRPLQQQ
jgi:uncharacterized protein with GYD domain